MCKQTPAMKRIVRRIQRWLSKNEYECGYGIMIYRCGEGQALHRNGVVDAWGGGCVIDPWTEFTTRELTALFERAKKLADTH